MSLHFQSVDLLTVDDLRVALDPSYNETFTPAYTAQLESVIAEVSGQITAYIQQHTLRAERSETYTVRGTDRALVLRGAKVDEDWFTVEVADVAFGEENYILKADSGLVVFLAGVTGRRSDILRVVVNYTGGLGADAASIKAGFPDLHAAAVMQCKYRMQRSDSIGGPLTIPQGMTATSDGQYGFLKHIQTVLDRYRRFGI